MFLIILSAVGFSAAALIAMGAPKFRRLCTYGAVLLPIALLVWTFPSARAALEGGVVSDSVDWVPGLGLAFTYYLDRTAVLFLWLIGVVGAAVFLHAASYMSKDPNQGRFTAFLLMFTTAMLGLVLSGNLLTLFIFWELTSITSYLLIGYKSGDAEARASALRALLVTAGGGLVMLVGILLLGQAGGSFELAVLLQRPDQIQGHALYPAITLCILAGALTKSAQFPFHFWLPGAMAAPTPVSAFLHSATMVKAGIFLLMRLHPILGGGSWWVWPLVILGATTMVMGALRAPLKHDLKQILAYSTLSVLGMLTMLLGLGGEKAIKAAVVLLLAHGLYKAALFMSAGSIEKAGGTRDVRKLSGLRHAQIPLFVAALAAAISMIGLPPLLGFLAKETLLDAVLKAPVLHTVLIIAVAVSAVALVITAYIAGIRPFLGAKPEGEHKPLPAPLWLGPMIPAVSGLLTGVLVSAIAPLVVGASGDILGFIPDFKVKLWHGFNAAFIFSLSILAASVVVWVLRHKLAPLAPLMQQGLSAKGIFDVLLRFVFGVSGRTAKALEGHKPSYGLSIILIAFLLLGASALLRLGFVWTPDVSNLQWQEACIGLLILGGVGMVFFSRSMMIAATALGAIGFGVAMVFFYYGAVDLAITQIFVETLMVLLFVLVVYAFPDLNRLSSKRELWVDGLIAGFVGLFMTLLIWKAGAVQYSEPISNFHVENAVPEGYGKNVVNVTLVDFRALDTLGEITVLFIAALGVVTLIRGRKTQ